MDKWIMKDTVVTVKANRLRMHNNADVIVLSILLFSARCQYCLVEYCLSAIILSIIPSLCNITIMNFSW